ncbi:phosphoglycerate mutase 2-like isoform X1 [Diorhabda sublineata]|uniref:phosphoglycerate mutase 2-like isoform X1 n=2 Tax=Diorhabda sublineata TaxID=1163346 RepID=UPI0024E04C52|nr:phosphoglycerate mutase 2-like isoform X1 [Diorhabda sublineata]
MCDCNKGDNSRKSGSILCGGGKCTCKSDEDSCCPTPCNKKSGKTKSKCQTSMGKTFRIVMVRHGESEWNKLNLFCGWFNADLSDRGREEAVRAGQAIKDMGLKFDLAFASVLKRSQDTLKSVLETSGQSSIPVEYTWRLNERHYGGLTGLNKVETVEKYGEEQVQIWRRSFDVPPPPITPENQYYNTILNDPIYANGPPKDQFPMFESLKLTIERTMPFWNEKIVPALKSGKRIIIAAHGNSLRGIVKHLDQISNEDIAQLNLPTGIPFMYTLDENMKPIESMKFLGDPETVKKAMEEVANQIKKK